MSEIELTILMPCLNEAETIEACVSKAKRYISRSGINAEIVIADNGSTDGSQEIAANLGARVVDVDKKGYGSALIGGIKAAHGKYIIMGDADDSYDFLNLEPFVEKLREGFDLVMGNRFRGGVAPGAMPPLHKYLGNPVLSFIGRLFFRSSIRDFHCGLRGFNRSAMLKLELTTSGMEFASEMVVKSVLNRLRVTEVPTTLKKDGRSRPPHLRSWHDGWRHLRFLLLYCPKWLFFVPGLSLIAFGLIAMVLVLPSPFRFNNITLDIHTLLIASTCILLGTQCISFSLLSEKYAIKFGILPSHLRSSVRPSLSLEFLLILGLIIALCGLVGVVFGFHSWSLVDFQNLNAGSMMRILIPSITLLAVGFQVAITAFFRSLLDID